MTAQELIAKVLELDANSTQEFDIDLGRIDILVDEFERTGKFKNHAKADNFLKRLKLAEAAPILARIADLAIGRLKGHAESSLYDDESKWASGVLAELDRIAKGEG